MAGTPRSVFEKVEAGLLKRMREIGAAAVSSR
jgi:hypothetical protein